MFKQKVNVRLDFLCEHLHGHVLIGEMTQTVDLEKVYVLLGQANSPEKMEVDECEKDHNEQQCGLGSLTGTHPVDTIGVVHGNEHIYGDHNHNPGWQILHETTQKGVDLTGGIGDWDNIIAEIPLINTDIPIVSAVHT